MCVRSIVTKYYVFFFVRCQRNTNSYCRTWQYDMFGGREWANILIAIGDIDDVVVAKVNDIIQERLSAPCATAEARQEKRCRRDRQAVRCVQQPTREATRWRDCAKRLDKKMAKDNDLWRRVRMPSWQWEKTDS